MTGRLAAAFVDPHPVAGGARTALEALLVHLPSHGVQGLSADSRDLADLVRSEQVDVVVGMDAAGRLAVGSTARRAGIPTVWWRHLTPRGRPDERRAARDPVDAVVCPTPRSATLQTALTPDAVVRCIPLGLAEPTNPPDDADDIVAPLGWTGHPVVGSVARLDPIKGQDVFLYAAAELAVADPTLRFVVVGGDTIGYDTDLMSDLRALTRALGLEDRVHFAGHVADPAPWFGILDVFVQSSLHEAFGLALLEAMQRGVPAVATSTDGPELLLGGGAGVLVRRGSAREVAEAVGHVLADPAGAARLADAGRRRARTFTASRMAAGFADLFRELTRGRHAVVGSPVESGGRPVDP